MTQDDVIFDDLNPPEPVITSGRACNVRYRLSANYAATSGDWIGLFRCSDDACELVGFEWAATDDPKDTGHRRRRLYFHADQIKRPLRAKDDDFYHFAYVTRVGRIAGQSDHFRIRQGEDPTSRSPALTSLGPADVCYAARQCLTNCRMLPITDGRNSQALEKFKGVIEQMEMRRANECSCHSAWQKGFDYQTPGKIIDSQGRLRASSFKSDLKSGCLRLETSSQNGCHGCQIALRELRSLKSRLETELTAGRTTLEEMEEDMEVQRQARAAQEQTGTNSKETGPVKEEELLDVIEDLKLALDWSKERERCLQHQLNLERTLRMELVRSREDLEGSRPVSGMRTSLSKQPDSHRFQVDITGTPSYNAVTKDKKCGSNDSLESPMSRCVTEKDVRGKMVLVCADCLQRKEQQKQQNQQQQQLKQNPSISIDRPRRPKKSDETDTESRKASARRLVSGTDRDTYLSEGQRASEVRLRQAVDLGEQQLVPVAFRDTEMVSNSQVCDTVSVQKLTEVLREESAHKVPDLQTVRDCLGEILALQAAVETSLSEINNKEAVVPEVSRKPEVKGTGQAVSSAVGMSLDIEKKSTYPEAVVVSTKEGKQPSIVSTLSPDRKAVDQKSFKPYGLGSPVIQITTDDQLSRANRKSDRQQGPGNTTVIVRSGDSLTTYSGSNLSLWLMLGNDSEPDRIIAKQNKKASHKSQRPPRGYELLTETKYRGSSSSNAPVDTERTSSGTNEVTKKRNEEDEAAAVGEDRTPSTNANYDGLNGISCYAPISSTDVRTTQTEDTFRPSGPSALSTMDTPYQSPAVQQRLTHPLNTPSISRQQLVAAAAALLSSNENLMDSISPPNQTSISKQQLAAVEAALLSSDETTADHNSTPNQRSISRQQLAAATAALLSLNEPSADSSSTPNQTETKKASRSTDNSYYRIMTSPTDFDIDDSLPITLTGPPSVIKTISSALSGIAKEYSAPDFKRSSRFEVVVPSACDPQQLAKPDAACSATQAEANLSTDASCSADGTNCNRCTKSAVKVTSTEGGIKFHLHSGILRSSPSSGTNDDIELIRRLSEMGARNAVLLESEERKESPKPEDPVFTSSSRFCFISDETIRCLSGILESAMHLTAALKVLDASSPEQTVQPSEVTVTDTAKSTVYNEECSPSTSTVAGRTLRQVKIIKPMPLGRSTGGARTPDSATSGTKPCKGMNSRQSGPAFQNARIISDGIREYHRRMKANVEVTEETQKALKVVEEYYFPDPQPKGNTEGNVTTESDAINSVREQHAVESVSQTGAAASVPSSDSSSPSPQDAAPKVRASTTMTTESAAVTCCPKTFLRQQDSLDLRRCDCQAHRNALPHEMPQDGSADEEVLPSEDATVEGPQQCLYSTDECAYTAPSGALSSKLRPSEADAAEGADGISSAVDGVSVKSTGNDLELPPELSMATIELEEITPVTSG